MKKKIIFWCDVSQVQYGLAKKLQDVSNYDLFAIFDVPYKQEKFFRTENIVKFQKKWFLHDGILEKEKPDIEYLKGIEEKYGINLWKLAINERFFYRFNRFYKVHLFIPLLQSWRPTKKWFSFMALGSVYSDDYNFYNFIYYFI